MKVITPQTFGDLKVHLSKHIDSFYFSSQTSTVIPYDRLEQNFDIVVNLSSLPKKMDLTDDGALFVEGPVTWQEGRDFLRAHGLTFKTTPTEELAAITAGVATSCTGERCFHFGTMRSQILSATMINYTGDERVLYRDQDLKIDGVELSEYQNSYQPFKEFKNAPFPRLEKEIDLLVGMEGQLGLVKNCTIEVTKDGATQFLLFKLPLFSKSISAHLELFQKIQSFRNTVIIAELIDAQSLSFLKTDERPVSDKDLFIVEIPLEDFDSFYTDFIQSQSAVSEEDIFEMTPKEFKELRALVPRRVNEENSRRGVIKKGTDIQVSPADFESLLKTYQEFASSGVQYNLFGHFGDAHLHFNFLPQKNEAERCQSLLAKTYQELSLKQASPFAEHGIGLIKQPFIRPYLSKVQTDVFKQLKDKFDPHRQFFSKGFLSLD